MDRRIVACTILTLLAAGCSAGGRRPGSPLLVRPAHVEEPMLTCSYATRAAREALMYMGYSVESVTAAKPDAPGSVVGTRDTGWAPRSPEAGTLYTVTVTISCSDAGSKFDATTNEGLATQLKFAQSFADALHKHVNRRKGFRPGVDDRVEPQGLVISVEPERSGAATADFGVDLPSAGVTPVKIAITNRSSRRYRFTRDEVQLVTVEGERMTPLSFAAISARMAPSGHADEVQAQLREKAISDGEIPPGATLTGYLYFEASAYSRARVVLTDLDSDEPEGFSVEF